MTKVEDHYDSPLDNLLFAVQDEREAQIKRFGHQHHPMTYDGAVPMYELREALYKDRWEAQRRAGEITWDTRPVGGSLRGPRRARAGEADRGAGPGRCGGAGHGRRPDDAGRRGR